MAHLTIAYENPTESTAAGSVTADTIGGDGRHNRI
jgi:hypothetical protein